MPERVIIVGTGTLAHELVAEFTRRGPKRHQVLGVISEAKDSSLEGFACLHLGTLEDLQEILTRWAPQRVVVAPDGQHANLPGDFLLESQADRRLVVESGVEAYERLTGKLAIESLPAGTVLFSSEFRPSRSALVFSRVSSVCIAGIGLLLSLPLLVGIACLIRLESPGPVLFIQERVGLGGRRFKLLKFRSMRDATRSHSEWVADNADRITHTGRWLRKFRLDELPQFINVIRGDMNLVGPRPHPVINRELFILVSRNTPQCGEQIPYYSLRSSVRPGITGWAQVRYKYANGLDEEMEKLRYDLYYIKHYSPFFDLRILLETMKVVFMGHRKAPSTPARAIPVPAAAPATLPGDVLPGLAEALHSEVDAADESERRRLVSRRRSELDSSSFSRAP